MTKRATAVADEGGEDWTRRGILSLPAAAMGVAALWTGTATAAVAPQRLTSVGLDFAYEAIVTLGKTEAVGATPLGTRVRIPITGGRFTGPRLSGTILPEGMDWQLIRADGVTVVEASYLMRERDGTLIHIHNRGLARGDYVRTTPVFDVPLGRHQWLNEAIFLGTIGPADPGDGAAVRITVYRVA